MEENNNKVNKDIKDIKDVNTDEHIKKTSRTNHPGLFTKGPNGRNGKTYEKWTEEACHTLLDKLDNWYKADPTNIYFKEFLYEEGLYDDVLDYIKGKFESVSVRIRNFDNIQEVRLVKLATLGITKENFTKFMLINKFGYAEKTVTDNTNTNTTSITWNEEKNYSKED